jgi:hypothetical protein
MLEVDVLVMYGEVHALHVAMQTTSAIALVVASKGNGDDDQGFAREIEPWESSEGGIYLLRELSAVAPSKATKFLPLLVELVSAHTYQHPCITLSVSVSSVSNSLHGSLRIFLELILLLPIGGVSF